MKRAHIAAAAAGAGAVITGSVLVAAPSLAGSRATTHTMQFSDGSLSGHVTGGTRHFDGATGTISGTAQSDNREKVKIVYQT